MFVYELVYGLIILGVLISFFCKKRNKFPLLYWLIVIVLILVVALRDQTMGPDTYNYLDYFVRPHNNLTKYQDNELEPGITILNDIINLVVSDKYVYSFIISVLSLLPIFILIYKRSKNRYLSLFLFVSFSVGASLFILSFSMMRQFLALGLWALLINCYMQNGEKIDRKCISLFVMMCFFHSSSLIVLLLLLIRKRMISKKIYFVSIISSVLIGFVIHKLMPLFLLLAIAIGKGFYFRTLNDDWSYSIIPTIPYVGLLLTMIYILPLKLCNHYYIKGLFLAVIIGNIMSFGNNVDRMCTYFYLLSILAIPYFFQQKCNKVIKFILLILILGYFSYKYWNTLFIMDNEVWDIVPYRSFLD